MKSTSSYSSVLASIRKEVVIFRQIGTWETTLQRTGYFKNNFSFRIFSFSFYVGGRKQSI